MADSIKHESPSLNVYRKVFLLLNRRFGEMIACSKTEKIPAKTENYIYWADAILISK